LTSDPVRIGVERNRVAAKMMSNSIRSNKGMALLAGAIFFVVVFIGLAFNHLDSSDSPR
jgi:hypothetical protein